MQLNHNKIIEALGGESAIANRLNIKSPSVYGWTKDGVSNIPDSRIIELGADIEATGLYTRQQLRPNDFALIWPELATAQAPEGAKA